MQRIINDPMNVVEDMLKGFLKAYPQRVAATPHPQAIRRLAAPVAGKVGVVTGGGSGHKPAFIGYLGHGLCDAVAVGLVFSSPPATAFHAAFKAADAGRGVACLYGNYAGDNMNVKMAVEMAEEDGIKVRTVVANDDVASAPPTEPEKRRGVAGEVLMWKVGGARAAMGGSLDEVIGAAQKAIRNTRSLGVGLSPCTIPAVGHPNFAIKEGTMELGIGHHGEPGIGVVPLPSADRIAETMVGKILPDLPFRSGDEAVVLVSGLGATPVMELFILYRRIHDLLWEAGIRIHVAYVGEYFTSLDMGGATLTLMKLDDELRECMDHPCDSFGLTQFQVPGGK
ncbi:MAG: dihydroxyacetone kinase subunit DhaK [Verrucomicrobiia bacterium]